MTRVTWIAGSVNDSLMLVTPLWPVIGYPIAEKAARLNVHHYHDDWLQNLLISASMAGYRSSPPQNR